MIVDNNPKVDVEALKARIAETAAGMSESPDSMQLLASSSPALLTRLEIIENGIEQCETLMAPRTSLPARLDRFPLNIIPFLTRFILAIDYLLFARQRESQKKLAGLLRQLVDTHRDLAGDLHLLARQVEVLKKANPDHEDA